MRCCLAAIVPWFQGAERDIIIVSCSRSQTQSGFIDSPPRLNVALTRGRYHLIVVGRVATLKCSKVRCGVCAVLLMWLADTY